MRHLSCSGRGDPCGRPIGINRRKSASISVGARAADVGLGGPLWSPASCSFGSPLGKHDHLPPPTVDHKGPPNSSSTALAPTDRLPSYLPSRLRLMRIGR